MLIPHAMMGAIHAVANARYWTESLKADSASRCQNHMLLLRTHHSPDSKAPILIGCLASCYVREYQRRELLRDRLLEVLFWLLSELSRRPYVVS